MRVRLVAGALVVVALAVVAIILATRGYSGYSARVVLADAGGLQQGSNVTVNGVTVGQVASLYVDRHGRAVAVVHLAHSAAPLGSGAHATVQIDGFFGERELMLTRGDYRAHPQASGFTIPVSDSGDSVRLDDVVDALNPDAQGALRTFLDEQGAALVGRGGDLAATLAQLPQTLPQVTRLLDQLSANQHAIGDLVDRSDRVVAQVAAQRSYLGSLVNSAHGALDALDSRRLDLGATVGQAPSTLAQARATLASLQGAAIPLAPAADGLRASAPSLTSALAQIPSFAQAAVPALDEVSRVSPKLQQLADVGTPVVSSLVPLTERLTTYTNRALIPNTAMLADSGAANLFGEMEGWARSTMGYDGSSHIFRFGATVSAASFKQLLAMLSVPGLPPLRRHGHAATGGRHHSAAAPSRPGSSSAPTGPLAGAVNRLTSVVGGAVGTVKHTAAALGVTSSSVHLPGPAPGHSSGNTLSHLLNYLVGR